jgi:formylglycine-generating enzyme required for sulfatase activity
LRWIKTRPSPFGDDVWLCFLPVTTKVRVWRLFELFAILGPLSDACRIAGDRPSGDTMRTRTNNAVFWYSLGQTGCLIAMVLLIGVWWMPDVLKEQYQWRMVMGPSVLTPDQERALAPKQEFGECARGCPIMVVVPAGSFAMGSPEGDRADRDERPQHSVAFAKPFAVGKYDVTFAEWDTCSDVGACPDVSDSTWGRGDRPVINVSWEGAKLYVAWLSRITGKEYRLLSESEWEYAARAGTTTKYAWGDDVGKGNANCEGCDSHWDNKKRTAPVGSFKPNAFGLYDMHGNVWQWVEDAYHDSYEGAPNDGSAWIARDDIGRRVIRGGAWHNGPSGLRAPIRAWSSTPDRSYDLGFRIGRTLTP